MIETMRCQPTGALEQIVLSIDELEVMRLEPITSNKPGKDDPFYALGQLADTTGQSLTNEQMDQIIYGN